MLEKARQAAKEQQLEVDEEAAAALLRQLQSASITFPVLQTTFDAHSEHEIIATARLLQRFIPVEFMINGRKFMLAIPTLAKGIY